MSEEIQKMVGRVVEDVSQGDDEIAFRFRDGSTAKFYHSQDCCESVTVDDVNGDWADLYGQELLVADERTNHDSGGVYESVTWTFYTFRSLGGSVDVRWCGESNGYYSESVDFCFTEGEYDADGKPPYPEKDSEGRFR